MFNVERTIRELREWKAEDWLSILTIVMAALGYIIFGLGIFLGVLSLTGWLFALAFNFTVGAIFHLPVITFWQGSILLLLLSWIGNLVFKKGD